MRLLKLPIFLTILIFSLLLALSKQACAQNKELLKLKQNLSQTKDSLTALRLLNKIGFLIYMKSADSSFYYGIKANRLATKLGDTRGKADALANIGIGLSLKGLYNQSLKYYSMAYQAYAHLPDTGEMAGMLMNSAISYSFTSDSDQAKQFSRRAFRLSKGVKADSVKSMLMANYADLAGLSPDSAAFFLNKAEDIALNSKSEPTLLFVMQQEAQLFLDAKNFAKTKELILRSIYLSRKRGWDYYELEGLNILGSYCLAVNKPDSALTCYQRIYLVSNTDDYVYWKVDVLKSLLRVYQLKRDLPNQAKINSLLVNALDRQVQNNNSFLGDYVKYSEDQQELEKMNQLDEINQKREILLVILIVIGLFVTLFILIVYLRSRKQQKLLLELNDRITDQNAILKENDEFKSKLLSMLAHDFRAPLGQMMGIITLLRDDELDAVMRLKTFDSIENDLENILVTFDNILQWVKRQSLGYELIKEELNIFDLMTQSISLFKQTTGTKNIIINNLLNPKQIISGDKEIIQFINRNLIHNAVKYSPANGIITISAKTGANNITISVRNEGKGMTEKQLSNLFIFKRQETNDIGAGMALSLCYEFITLLNGKIWAESTPGNGATFYYSLPL